MRCYLVAVNMLLMILMLLMVLLLFLSCKNVVDADGIDYVDGGVPISEL